MRDDMSFYRSSGFWSVVVASTALILSQLPPITKWLPNQRLEIRTSTKMFVNNTFGIVSYTLYFILKNTGNTDVKAEKAVLSVQRPDGMTNEYVAEGYTDPKQMNIFYPFVSISIEEGEEWVENLSFNPNTPPDIQEKFNELRLSVSLDILEANQQASLANWLPQKLYVARTENVEKAMQFFERNFQLPKGEYVAKFTVYGKGDQVLGQSSYRFTVYEYHIKMFKSQVEDYKYGSGVYLPVATTKYVTVDLIPIQ